MLHNFGAAKMDDMPKKQKKQDSLIKRNNSYLRQTRSCIKLNILKVGAFGVLK